MDNGLILSMVKARLGRENTTAMDGYLIARINAAIKELADSGIHVVNNDRDIIFVVDIVCWQYSNRDKPSAMPEWMRIARRERFLQEACEHDS